ncbi:DUF2971 domain-containing protein [Epilithonimonas ginsengisoli]|uniref:DUF2971 domain-containing protein n=1 Tax=Epilithonimonas ginsengisoli TaxID=1245592 RepID=A0ABU4JDG2_9FLAO|nr:MULTISPECIES: DUF2971 domain-containing protein [Chryseobacterium group]MBV6878566.1 DUF2971 domain-containing protein [Epilithonimonas sp. FP105]MDW8547591.1 DUF2971 domain-containing protein [Epilithonimonas ginsengisoli]OAH75189.1 hypothetical protein AXA65_04250 [Chryseobacterium sp. FP211-J200]
MSLFKFKNAKSINDFNRDIQTILDDKIWFSGIESLNEPFEKVYSTKSFDEYDGTEEIVTNFFIPLREHINEYFEKVGILSLCGRNTNLVMWSHYADNHKGYCIEYNLNLDEMNSLNFETEDEVFLFEVEYDNSPIDFLSLPSNFQFYLRRKNKLWEYENEFRFISSKQRLHNIPKNSIKAIYLGANVNNIVNNTFLNLCKEKNIKLYQTYLSNNSYELKFKKIF